MSSFFATLSGLAAPFSSLGVTASGWRSFARASSLAFSSSVTGSLALRRPMRRWLWDGEQRLAAATLPSAARPGRDAL